MSICFLFFPAEGSLFPVYGIGCMEGRLALPRRDEAKSINLGKFCGNWRMATLRFPHTLRTEVTAPMGIDQNKEGGTGRKTRHCQALWTKIHYTESTSGQKNKGEKENEVMV